MKKLLVIMALFMSVIGLKAQSISHIETTKNWYYVYAYCIGDSPQNYENTDPEGFAKLIAEPDVVILDVRTAEEFNEGHIENALNIDVKQSDFMQKAKATLSKEKRIAVYCRSGKRSANAATELGAEGYKVVNLYGGILAWKEAGKSCKDCEAQDSVPLSLRTD